MEVGVGLTSCRTFRTRSTKCPLWVKLEPAFLTTLSIVDSAMVSSQNSLMARVSWVRLTSESTGVPRMIGAAARSVGSRP